MQKGGLTSLLQPFNYSLEAPDVAILAIFREQVDSYKPLAGPPRWTRAQWVHAILQAAGLVLPAAQPPVL